MRHKKRLLAGILAAMMAISSLQFSGGNVFAAELNEPVAETVTADSNTGDSAVEGETPNAENSSDAGNDRTDGGSEEGDSSEDGRKEPSGAEDAEKPPIDGSGQLPENGGTQTPPADGSEIVDDGMTGDDGETADDGTAGDGSETAGDGETADDGTAGDGSETADDGETVDDDSEMPDEDVENDTMIPDEGESGNGSVSDNTIQISGNDLLGTEEQEIFVTEELQGAYQFGDAPSAQPGKARSARAADFSSAEAYLYEQMLARNASIDISKYEIPRDKVGNLVIGVINENPDLYFVERSCSWSYNPSTNLAVAVKLTYGDANSFDDAAFQRATAKAVAAVDGSMSDLQKAIVLHDYLAVNCEYDEENLLAGTVPMVSHSAYGSLVNRIAVCDGYALAYKYLLKQVGINCYMVTSTAMNHAWNLIELNGAYYQVDVTWDDPVWDRLGRVTHNYMFCSDDTFKDSSHKHHDWSVTYGSEVVDYKAVDTRYDTVAWTSCTSPIVFAGDGCYYTSFDSGSYQASIRKGTLTDLINGTGTAIQSIGGWPVWGDSGGVWQGAFSGLFQIDGRLYYNDSTKIYSIAMDGTDLRTEFTPDTTNGYIYGSAYCQGKILYVLHQDPRETGKETVLTADIAVSGGEQEVYIIRYVLDGGTNASENPITYTPETETIVLKDAVRAGYQFGGWYKDAGFSERVTQIEKGSKGDLTLYARWVKEAISIQGAEVSLKTGRFTYNGGAQRPKVVASVMTADGKKTLTEGTDYQLTYSNNVNAGTATVMVNGHGDYIGSASKTFEIAPAPLVIRAKNKTILIGSSVPAGNQYEYEVVGLAAGDRVATAPSFVCEITSTAVAGQYEIVPSGADAGANYTISYENGRLTVAEEYVACTVTFDMQGHGTAPDALIGIRVGSTIAEPPVPKAEGYRFDHWYQDAACTKIWNFETDIVQKNLTLYAKWLGVNANSGEDGFALQEIADVTYTGKACKPAVSVYDGNTLLKAGRDYQIKYYNNINANVEGKRKTGNGAGENFKNDLPYVEIIGKGNYTEVARVNFNILQAAIGNGGESAAAGVTLKASDQLVTSKKTLKPFSSIKYKKAMRLNTDFTLRLVTVDAFDDSEVKLESGMELSDAVIPAGYNGEFQLTVTGKGNYTGSVQKTIYVKDKAHLIKNATITLGKNLKNIRLTDKTVKLTAATESGPDVFVVKYGKTILTPGQDYICNPSNLEYDRVGKATLTIIGVGEYAGSKTATFTIKGRTFSAKTVEVEDLDDDKEYTGRALTQNNVELTYYDAATETEIPLQYGKDYTISYSKNVNKGTATMTFKGNEEEGYSGSFKKTFKIEAVDIDEDEFEKQVEGIKNLTFSYCKAGVKPVEEISLTYNGFALCNGRDYTLKYINNKAVAGVSDEKPPTVIIKGKGNYKGELRVPFRIDRADLNGITVKTTPVVYKSNKAAEFVYKPAVKLVDGKSALRAGKDYEIEYRNNTQADYDAYIEKWKNQTTADDIAPVAVITEKAGSAYKLSGQIVVPLPIYQTKLSKQDVQVEIVGDTVYTGGQVLPAVKVYYGTGRTLLTEGKDYTVSYGANNKSGKNKGSVVISGVAPEYGGSVTVKFDILKKTIVY